MHVPYQKGNQVTDILHIPKVVVTGGPCGGKTTGMSYCVEKLGDIGFKVFLVEEMATRFKKAGLDLKSLSKSQFFRFEEEVLRMQLAWEDSMSRLAEDHLRTNPGSKPLVLTDRGTMDGEPYIGKERFAAIVHANYLKIPEIRDRRYNGAVHLVTAANGAEDYYQCENNSARWETAEQARETDEKTIKAWTGVPHLSIIDNSTDFQGKIRRTFQAMCRILGVPVPIEYERKFLVESIDWDKILHYTTVDIEQVYLFSSNEEEEIRVRKRGQDNSYIYFKTRKVQTDTLGKRLETEHMITAAEYFDEIDAHADSMRSPVRKKRTLFPWKNQYFELDVLSHPKKHKGLILLEIELTEENDTVQLPPFIKVIREVTGEKEYSNAYLALSH